MVNLGILVTLGIACVCASAGYMIFDYSYDPSSPIYIKFLGVPESEVGLYTFEWEHTEEIPLYTVLGGNHQYYFLTRNLPESNCVGCIETMQVRNDVNEELTLSVIERHTDPANDRPFEIVLPARNSEYIEMYGQLVIREAIVVGLGVVAVFSILPRLKDNHELTESDMEIQKQLNEVKDD